MAICGYLGFLVRRVLVGALAEMIGLRWAVAVAGALIGVVLLVAPALRAAARVP